MMPYPTPNHLVRNHDGMTSFPFGTLHSITAVSLTGNNHQPHIDVRFVGGVKIQFDPAVFAALLRDGPAALAKLPFTPDVSDAVGGME